ncbi:hypothetical protein [Bradyrhizobium sp. ORS 111]|uniref:hypothetical protein n=1 Tax=Bradyrhizobium sp. ORS 111 TaxID=1685958 RepID=UPI00388CF669
MRYVEAEAEALIRSHLGVVTALTDALVEHGTLTSEQVDQVIDAAIAGEMLDAERGRRREIHQRAERAAKFKAMIGGG